MKKRSIVLALFLVLLVGVSNLVSAQGIIGERQLRKFPKGAAAEEIRCGDYFIFGPTMHGVDPTRRIGFLMVEKPSDPKDVFLTGSFLPENLEVIIDNGKKVPTAEILYDREAIRKVVIRISQEDYNNSPCLKKTEGGKKVPI